MTDLPDDGDVIEFETVPAGSLCRPQVRYRVEKKPLDREWLLVDVVSGHASRVPGHEFKRAKWVVGKPQEKIEAEPAAAAKPLDGGTEGSGGVLDLKPLQAGS